MTSREEVLLKESLDRQAAQAPGDYELLDQVHARLRRRRSGRTTGALVLACAAVAASALGVHSVLDSGRTPPVAQHSADTVSGPEWRWESYKTIQFQVPASWTTYVSGPSPCVGFSRSGKPTIGRVDDWSDREMTDCPFAALPVAQRHEYVWLGGSQPDMSGRYEAGWVEETRLVNGIKISVLSKDAGLRARILDSAVAIGDTDQYGCKTGQPVAPAAGSFGDLGTIESVDVCEYLAPGSLIASSRLTGKQALDLATALSSAPAGEPPAIKPDCAAAALRPGHGYNNRRLETYLLTVKGTNGDWQGRLTYTTCYTGGRFPFDDGVTKRLVPTSAISLFRTGPHRPYQTVLTRADINTAQPPQR
ncbi:hypothetical protein [Streptomyces sp. SID13031]|uniref:hypothetical protein n=1 Tax=Streptomyces sp. SID13031 TaxID=2706046 RepID=UPI0013C7DB23|nr:hypothetical protein [Streptomyces sp. SID13031]NEA31794.1 hypothetical protein [Streptomyces sp. SID13031]